MSNSKRDGECVEKERGVSAEKGRKAKAKDEQREDVCSKGTCREQIRTSRSTTFLSSQGPSLLSNQKARQGAG